MTYIENKTNDDEYYLSGKLCDGGWPVEECITNHVFENKQQKIINAIQNAKDAVQEAQDALFELENLLNQMEIQNIENETQQLCPGGIPVDECRAEHLIENEQGEIVLWSADMVM